MQHSILFSIFISSLLLLISLIGVIIISINLYESKLSMTMATIDLPLNYTKILNRSFSTCDCLNYIQVETSSYYIIENSSIITLLYNIETIVNYKIIPLNVSEGYGSKFSLIFDQIDTKVSKESNYEYFSAKTAEIFEFQLSKDQEFLYLSYSSDADDQLVSLAKTIISQFAPKTVRAYYDTNQTEFTGEMNISQHRSFETINQTALILKRYFDQNDLSNSEENSQQNFSYFETSQFILNGSYLNYTLINQKIATKLDQNIGSQNKLVFFTNSTLETRFIMKNHSQNLCDDLNYNFSILKNKTIEASLYKKINTNFSSDNNNTNSSNFNNKSNNSRILAVDLESGIEIQFFQIQIKKNTIALTSKYTLSKDLQIVFEICLKYNSLTYCIEVNELLLISRKNIFTGLKAAFSKLSSKLKSNPNKLPNLKTPNLPFAAYPFPGGLIGELYIRFEIAITYTPNIDLFNFMDSIDSETDFSIDKYKGTKFYQLTDKKVIQQLKTEPIENIFTEAKNLTAGMEVSASLNGYVGAKLSVCKIGEISAELKGSFITLAMSNYLKQDYFSKKMYLAAEAIVNVGKLYVIFTLSLWGRELEYEYPIIENSIWSSQPKEIIGIDLSSFSEKIFGSENDFNQCETPVLGSGCGTLPYFSCQTNSDEIIQVEKSQKGIENSCEFEDPELDFIQKYIRNCNCPYLAQNENGWVSGDFRLGLDFPIGDLSVEELDKNFINFDDLRTIVNFYSNNFKNGCQLLNSLETSSSYTINKENLKKFNSYAFKKQLIIIKNVFDMRYLYDSYLVPKPGDYDKLPKSLRSAFYLFWSKFYQDLHDTSSMNQFKDPLLTILKYFYTSKWTKAAEEISIILPLINLSIKSTDYYYTLQAILNLIQYSCTKCETASSIIEADIIYIMDGSGSILSNDFSKEISFFSKVSEKLFENQDNKVRIAIIQYSNVAALESSFSSSKDYILGKLAKVSQMSGYTYVSAAFQMATQLFENSPIAKKFVFILTDGQSNDYFGYSSRLYELKQINPKIISIGIGENINYYELLDYSTEPENVYMEKDFEALEIIKKAISQEICYSHNEMKEEDNLNVPPKTQTFYKISLDLGSQKALSIKGSNLEYTTVYGSFSSKYPNYYFHDFEGVMIDDEKYMPLVFGNSKNNRILQNSSQTLYLSVYTNETSGTNLTTKLLNNFTSKLPCKVNCSSCDDSGIICYQCENNTWLVENECAYLKIEKSNELKNFESILELINPKSVVIEYTEEINEGRLAGFIILLVFLVMLIITLIFVDAFLIKKIRKSTKKSSEPVSKTHKENKEIGKTEINALKTEENKEEISKAIP